MRISTIKAIGACDHSDFMATKTKKYPLPVRLSWIRAGKTVIAGTPGSYGDAGWTTMYCASAEHRASIMARFPAARMRGWWRIPSA